MIGKIFEIGSLMKRAGEFGSKFRDINEKLKEMRIEGSAGGGLVKICTNGLQEAVSCKIDPVLLQQPDAELLEELILTAVNDAAEKSREQQTETMKSLASDIDIGDLSSVIGKIVR
ncbi:MAG: YbaB/EbfC family nucleoid-associated protein [Planctomycetaceae bacterium]|jgi:DNA-binding YbaB/EbfC family protein|nr:YbaB/EbfC family nucleoid-associated protein [Planctomycetaceae bacterium]